MIFVISQVLIYCKSPHVLNCEIANGKKTKQKQKQGLSKTTSMSEHLISTKPMGLIVMPDLK